MSKQPTFEDAIADLKNITAWNISEHMPLLLAGLQDAALRLEALEKKAALRQGSAPGVQSQSINSIK